MPNLTFIMPNNCNNSHNDLTPGCGVANADAWLAANLPAIIDELGPKVIPGSTYAPVATLYANSRLICDVLGLPVIGFGIFEQPILGIWQAPTQAAPQPGAS